MTDMTDMELADWLHRWRECLRCEAPCQAYPCICSQRTDAIIAALRRGSERPPSGEMVALEEAIIAMAEDGWLYHGVEGMSESQEKCYQAYLAIQERRKLSAAEAEGRKS